MIDVTSFTQEHCWLTTTGRVTGRRHTSELRFVPADGGVFLVSGSGGLRQWCLDLVAEEQAVVRIDDRQFQARAARVDDPQVCAAALASFRDKYGAVGTDRGGDRGGEAGTADVYRLVFLREVVV